MDGVDDMNTATTTTVRARDSTAILVRRWRPAGQPWATVVIVHGVAEHSGRYERVASWLAGAGLDVIAADLRGFGGSGGQRAFVERWRLYHDDLADHIAAARAGAGDRPVALLGHSMGGLIALGYCVAEPPRALPEALVLSAPGLDSSIPAWKRLVARVLSRVAPTVLVPNDFDGAILSRDPAVGERYLADPLNVHATTGRLGAEAFAEQIRVRAALGRLSIPTFVYHGEADRLVPTVASEPLAAVPGVTRRTYPGLRHESHNEPEGQAVIADVVAWLRSVLESGHN